MGSRVSKPKIHAIAAIPQEYVEIDALKWSEEVRLGTYLIELALGQTLKVGTWDLDFFNCAKLLFEQLDEQTQQALALSYRDGINAKINLEAPNAMAIQAYKRYSLSISRELADFIIKASLWIDKRELPLDDWVFAFEHTKGCSTLELSIRINRTSNYLIYAINKGLIKATKVHGHWLIEQKEIIRVLDIDVNWISLRRASVNKNIYRETLEEYVKDFLGVEIRPNLSGTKSFPRSVYNDLDVLIPKISEQKEIDRGSWPEKRLKEEELSPGLIHRKYQKHKIELGSIQHWIKSELLLSKKRGKFRVISANDFKLFAIGAAMGLNKVRPHYQSVFLAICEEEKWI